jgi:Cupredoxin-like domain
MPRMTAVAMLLVPLVVALMGAGPQTHAQKQPATINITVKNHQFQPAEVQAPANVPITLRVRNLDPGRMEFESVSLRVEKVVAGNGEGIIQLRPLSPGRYDFYDDFNQETNGVLVVR